MTDPLASLLDLLDLEPLEYNIYRGYNHEVGSGRVFGGQVLAQALVAARRTVDEPRDVHSLHGYFILPGDVEHPIVYFVDRLRDGKSFTTRRVTGIQHGEAIFSMTASFHRAESGEEHQAPMPDAPDPESLTSELEMIRQIAERIPPRLRGILTADRAIDIRPVEPADFFLPEPRPPEQMLWLRATGEMPGDLVEHQAVLAYASDYQLLATALQPHGLTVRTPQLQVASLDHSIWFHKPFCMDEWLLYVMDSPIAAGARGFSRGSVYTRDGRLVASVAQEGLMRIRG